MRTDTKTIENGGEKLTEDPVDTTHEADVVEREATRLVSPAAVTPPDPTPLPDPDADGRHDLRQSGYYLNRELTWLNFNFRVLNEAEDDRVPLLERVKFIAIVSSNIDEFFMKRIGGLKQQRGAGIQDRTIDGRTPEDQLEACRPLVRRLEERKYRALLRTLDEMAQHGIVITTYEHLRPRNRITCGITTPKTFSPWLPHRQQTRRTPSLSSRIYLSTSWLLCGIPMRVRRRSLGFRFP